ncbi:hypothetical protein [Pseudodesulfovibrio senegalensis]|uniref:Uncharacterized protein n=1 Tax=Pseudodesulfovibrio senegalensis TaxID=1721087 RepID=A0A6N6N2Y9_9BACT|nr:hypothetical protein [Pseudodesulfovibrio senegalensis]KAB1442082.1 hypothetical protein F8A88_06345 [Pseudodesulfovibrio senegalensis]
MPYEWLFTQSVFFFCAMVLFFRCLDRVVACRSTMSAILRRFASMVRSALCFRGDADFYCFFHTHSFVRK